MQQEIKTLKDQLRRGAISRREFIGRAALLGISAGSLSSFIAACATTPPSTPAATTNPGAAATAPKAGTPAPAGQPTPAPAAQIKRGGTLVHSYSLTVPTMDPHINSSKNQMFFENVYEGLVGFKIDDPNKPEAKVVGLLAESWEQKDTKTLVFRLRKGVQFHDGSEFDAEAARWNFQRAKEHPKSNYRDNLAFIDTVTALDKYTLEIKAKVDTAPMLRLLAYDSGAQVRMMSKAAFEKNGEEWLQRNAVGTGAFKFKQWISDDRVITERNPNYYVMGVDGKPLPYLDGAVFRFIPDATVALVEQRSGSLHFIEWPLEKDAASIKGDPNLELMQMTWNSRGYFQLGFNTKDAPFNDVRLRQAALYGIDHEGMWKALGFGIGEPWYHPQALKGTLGYDDTVMKYEYNPAKVKDLLKQAGYPDGISIELLVIAREPERTIGEYAQQMWNAVGIKTKLNVVERLATIDACRNYNFQAYFWRGNHGASVIDPENAGNSLACGSAGNWTMLCDKEIDALMVQGLAELDTQKRAVIYHNVWQLLQERAYLATGWVSPVLHSYRKEVRGLTWTFAVANLSTAWLA